MTGSEQYHAESRNESTAASNGTTVRRNLDRTIHLGIIAASIVPIIIVFGVMSLHLESSFKKVVYGQIEDMVYKDTIKVESFLSERLALLKLFLDNNSDKLMDRVFFKHQLDALRNVYGNMYLDLGLLDLKGKYRNSAFSKEKGREEPLTGENWFVNAMTRDTYISDVSMSDSDTPYFVVAIKVAIGDEIFILKSSVDFSDLSAMVGDLRTGSSGSVSIINRAGVFQFKSGKNDNSDGRFLATLAEKNLRKNRASNKPVTFELDDIIYSMAPLKDGDWVLVFQQKKDEVLDSVISARRTLLLVLAMVSAFVVIVGLSISNRIIRQIDRLEKEKEELNDKILEAGKLSSLGQMAAGIAHEINNPVAIMVEEAGWIQDILEDIHEKDANTEEISRSVAQIKSQGIRCRNITHKLLTFARKPDHKVEAVDVNALIREMLDLAGSKALNIGVTISFNPDPELPFVAASSTDLHQVFMNLIYNALDAMEAHGGQLKIEIGQIDKGRGYVFISDTGEGISPENILKIYDPFFTTKPAGKGTGLGLSICYGIVKNLGGEIKVSSQPGAGTKFQVILPLHEQQ